MLPVEPFAHGFFCLHEKNYFQAPKKINLISLSFSNGLLGAIIFFLNVPVLLRAQSVDMGDAAGFAVMADAALTLGGSTIFGDIGAQSGVVTGPFTLNGMNLTLNTQVMSAAQISLTNAYESAATRTPTITYFAATDLGGLTLAPGVYKVDGAISMTSNLTLDAGNNPNAVWIFETTAALNTTAGVSTLLTNGAQANNIFWQVGGAVTTGAGTTFDGTLMAYQAITLGDGTSLNGRALSLNAAVTLNVVTINLCVINSALTPLLVGSNSSNQSGNFISETQGFSSTYVGYNSGDSNNLLSVANANTFLINTGDLTIGYQGANNLMVISKGGALANVNAWIGNSISASNNSVLVSDAGSTWSNSGTLTIGNAGSGTMTVANEGSISASGITIANQPGSIGTMNIGSFNGNNGAGTILSPTITLGSGSGTINFNQTNTATLISDISGNGALNQLGTGTTILDGDNSFTGITTISKGTLQVGSGLSSSSLSKSSISMSQFSSVKFSNLATSSTTVGGIISGAGNFIQSGGTTILANANTLTGTTTIDSGALDLGTTGSLLGSTNVVLSSGGTLLLGSSQANSISTNAQLTLSGGILSMGSGSRASAQTFASLTLTASSTIDFANLSGTSSLNFGSISGMNASHILTVHNWSGQNLWGTTSSGDPTHLLVNSGGLNNSDLQYINFYGTSKQFLGTGALSGTEIVPVPEPSVWVSGLILLGSLALLILRKMTT